MNVDVNIFPRNIFRFFALKALDNRVDIRSFYGNFFVGQDKHNLRSPKTRKRLSEFLVCPFGVMQGCVDPECYATLFSPGFTQISINFM